MFRDIDEWLQELGLARYAALFAENEVDLEVLSDLTEHDLKDLEIPLGHRKKLLKAIGALPDSAKPDADAIKPTESAPTPHAEAERRQLTVMFCDLVDSTALSARLDPEDLQEVIRAYQDTCARAIARYQGYIAKYMGDGILVYFGYPQAHEDDSERAARAGLDIVEAIADIGPANSLPCGLDLSVRVGINTGPVVVGEIVGEGVAEEASVVGETPNVAARLQALAQPNQVVIGPLTRQLIGDAFILESLGEHFVKGIAQPVQAWRVARERDVDNGAEFSGTGGESSLVGRQEELGLLLRAWEAAKHGHGQAVLIQGEPGIGKSRLATALRAKLKECGETLLGITIHCSAYHGSSTLYPVIEQLKRGMGWSQEDGPEEHLNKLETMLMGHDMPLTDAVPLFAELLTLPLPEGRYAPLNFSPQELRDRTLDAMAGWLLGEAETRPVLCVWEDLHWGDPTTLELLGLCIEQSPTVSMMNVLTYRPEFLPPWPMRSHMMPITLNRLERPEVEAMIMKLLNGRRLPPEAVDYIVDKTDGVPLYVEELAKAMLEGDFLRIKEDHYELTGPLSGITIPTTLQDLLMARLDRLPTVREVAQLGSIFGREFSYEMIQAIAAHKEMTLQSGLDQLVHAELLYQRGRRSHARYIFKHALVQDAAYQSLLKRTRKYYHQQVAELLEGHYPEIVQTQPELVAQHYARAENDAKAVEFLIRFADKVAGMYAHVEAVAALEAALVHAQRLPDEAQDRNVLEIVLRLAESLHFLGRRQQLVDRLQKEQQRLDRLEDPSLAGKYYFWLGFAHSFLGHRAEADETLRRSLEEATQSGDEAIIGRVHRALAMECSFSGRPLEEAVSHGRQAVAMLERTADRFWLAQALFTLSYVSYYTGDFETALDAANRLDALGAATGSGRAQANAAMIAGLSYATRGDAAESIEAEQRALALSPDNFEKAYILACLGKAHLEAGDAEQAVSLLEQAVELADQVRSLQLRSWFRTMLGDAYVAIGEYEKAMGVVREALKTSTDIKYLQGVGLSKQVLGRIACAQGLVTLAKRNFDEASETLAAIGARFELARTHMDIATLAHVNGDVEIAASHLTLAHTLFTALQVPAYVERTNRLRRQFGLPVLG